MKKISMSIMFLTALFCFKANAQNWLTTGNSGLTTSNFLGTTDNKPLIFKTNNIERGRIFINGKWQLGISADNAQIDTSGKLSFNGRGGYLVGGNRYAFHYSGDTVKGLYFNLTQNQYQFINSAKTPLLYVNADNGNSGVLGTFKIGAYTLPKTDGANGQVLKTNGSGTVTWATGGGSQWITSGSNIYYNTGNVGIGTSSPLYPLEILSSSNTQLHFLVPPGGPYYTSIGMGYNGIGNNTCARIDLGFESLSGNSNSYLSFRTGQSPFAGDADISTERMRISSNGNVGIGTTTPGYILDVAARMRIRSGGSSSGVWLMNVANNVDAAFIGMQNDNYVGLYGSGVGWGFVMNTFTGNVGIGTSSTSYKLNVNGTIRSKEVRVETGWSDYVFEKDYKLRSLDEVAEYINQNKHLPGIPSAKEIQDNGLAVGEVQSKMMAKIEEQMLYILELQQQINELKKEIKNRK